MEQTGPRPQLCEHRIGDGQVVKEGFVGPLARLVSGQGIGSVGWMFLAGLLMKDTPAEISIRPYGGGRTGLRVCEEIVAGPRACLRRPGRQA